MARNGRISTGLALAGLLLAGAFAGCGLRNGDTPAEEGPELRTYRVPKGLERDVHTMLRATMQQDPPVGRITRGPGGTLVVVAPESLHRGIEQLIGEIGSVEAPPESAPVQLTYWFVVGRPADDLSQGHRSAPGSRLDAIAGVLDEVAAAQGPMEFRLLERLDLTSMGQDSAASMHGNLAQIRQSAALVGESVVADLRISVGLSHAARSFGVIETRVRLDPGRFVVLGQSGYRDPSSEGPLSNDGTLYYVVSSSVEP